MFTMVTLGSCQQTKLLQNRGVVCSQLLIAFLLQSFSIGCRPGRTMHCLMLSLRGEGSWSRAQKHFAAIFNKKFLLFVSQCQCFVFVYFLGWQVQSCKYVNVNNCQLSATSLSSVRPPTNTLNIKNKETSNIHLFQFYCLLLDKVGDFVRSWSGLRAA